MANTSGISTLGPRSIRAMAVLWPSSGLKIALYVITATVGPTTAAYTATGEASGAGYTAGGEAIDSSTAPQASGATTFVTPAAPVAWAGVTLTDVSHIMIYDTGQSNEPVGVWSLGGAQSVTSGLFTVTFPANDASNALWRRTQS